MSLIKFFKRVSSWLHRVTTKFFQFLSRHFSCIHEYKDFSTRVTSEVKGNNTLTTQEGNVYDIYDNFYTLEQKRHHWFYFYDKKGMPRVLFTDQADKDVRYRYSISAILTIFTLRLSPIDHITVFRQHPTLQVKPPNFSLEPYDKAVKLKTINIDFDKGNIAGSFETSELSNIPEFKEHSMKLFLQDLRNSQWKTNLEFTGIPNYGEWTSPTGQKLSDKFLCRECGRPLFKTDDSRSFRCLMHGIVTYPDGAVSVPVEEFRRVVELNTEYLYQHCYNGVNKFIEYANKERVNK